MPNNIKNIQDISPCVQVAAQGSVKGQAISGTMPLRDYLFSLDAMAHAAHDTSGDGVFTEEEFNYLKTEGLAPALETVPNYSIFSQNIDRYVEQQMSSNEACLCPNGVFEETEAGPICQPLIPSQAEQNKAVPSPASKRTPLRTGSKPAPEPKKISEAPPPARKGRAPQDIDYYPPLILSQGDLLYLDILKKGIPQKRSSSLNVTPDRQRRKFLAVAPNWKSEGLPRAEKVPTPCRPLVKPPKKIGLLETIGGGLAVAVPQVAALLIFLNDPGCWGRIAPGANMLR